MSEKPLPTGVQLTPLDETFKQNPYPLFDRLRQECPVHHDHEFGRYFVTDHDSVKEMLRDRDLWTDPRKANPGTFHREFLANNMREDDQPSMLLMDEPDHRRLRSLVSASFTPAAVERWRPRTKEVVQRVLDDIDSDEFDLIKDFAGPIPTVVIAELLGIDPAMHGKFKQWSDTSVVASFNPFPTEEQVRARDEANEHLNSFFYEEIKARRNNLGEDLLSDMIRAEEDGKKLTMVEMVTQANLLLIAGNVTTTDLIGNGVKALLDHPEQWQKLRANPDLIKNTVEEMLRFESPVVNSGRIANRDLTLQGCPIGQGQSITTALSAANRDPEVYPEPNRFDIERADTHHQSFGGGRHLCLGAHLARLEAQEAILGLMQRYPNLQHSDKGYEFHAIPSFRGMSQFYVKTGSD